MKKHTHLALLSLCFVLVFAACKKKETGESTPDEDFDKSAMLSNIGSGIIVTSYQNLKTKVTSLDSASMVFTANTTTTNLLALRKAFKQAYLAWQSVSVFEFGPAESELLRTNSNTFPTDTAQVMINVHSGSYDLSAINNIDAKGFPAIDYLLFSVDTVQLIALYTSDTYAANRKSYLNNLTNELKTNVNTVYTAWSTTGGNYLSTFTSSLGSDVGSSLGYIVNQLNYDFETLKNYKIGIPLGKKTLGTPLPEKVEGYYAKNSVELAVAQLKALQNLYLGKNAQGTDGVGIDDYLTHLKAQYNGGLLSDAIKAQLALAINKLESIPDPLSETIMSNAAIVDAAYTELQKLVVLFKTDMPSAMGVLITYQDNDGD